jgi:hypothetical protein
MPRSSKFQPKEAILENELRPIVHDGETIEAEAAGSPVVSSMEAEPKTDISEGSFDEASSTALLKLLSSEKLCEGVPSLMRTAWQEQTNAR